MITGALCNVNDFAWLEHHRILPSSKIPDFLQVDFKVGNLYESKHKDHKMVWTTKCTGILVEVRIRTGIPREPPPNK